MIQGSDGMGVQIIHNQHDLNCIRILLIQQPLDLLCPIFAGAVFLSVRITSSIERFREHKDAGGSIPDVLVVLVFDPTVFRFEAFPGICKQLNWLFVHADHRVALVVGTGVDR